MLRSTTSLAAIAVAAGLAASARAATIHPTRTDDPSSGGTLCSTHLMVNADCSLRNALLAAADGVTVSLAPPAPAGPYLVQQGGPLVMGNATLQGTGARTSEIERTAGLGGVLAVNDPDATATVNGVTITGGRAPFEGGGVVNHGDLTINNSAVVDNAIVAQPGTPAVGGGIHSYGRLDLFDTTVSGNEAVSADGATGGGLALTSGDVEIVNSTVAGNMVRTDPTVGGGFSASAGGIEIASASVYLADDTIADNSALGEQAAFGNLQAGGVPVLATNTIIAGGTATGATQNCNPSSISSQGHNIEDRNQCGLTGPGDETNADPMLGPLQDNGGPTDTLAPGVDSPAIDRGDPAVCADGALADDQRGLPRRQGAACDVGAVELQPLAPAITAGAPTGVGPTAATMNATINTHGFPVSWTFEYGTTDTYGSSTATQTLAAGIQPVSATITGLAPGTTYHFKLVASTAGGTTETTDQTVTTPPDAPAVTTGAATDVTTTTATLSGSLSPQGASTTYHFDYGPTTALGSATLSRPAGNGTDAVSATAALTGLRPGATYHYVLVASNEVGERDGAPQTFTTASARSPGPSITALRETKRTWVAGGLSARMSGARQHARGTVISFTLNERATVGLAFQHNVRGHRGLVTAGTLRFIGHAGPNRVRFQGRISARTKLKPGAYTLRAAATDSAGRTSAPMTLHFTIVRR
jgi:hypothetical protein